MTDRQADIAGSHRESSLALAVPTDSDAARWHELFADPEVMRFIGDGSVRDQIWYEQFVTRQQALAASTGVCLYSVLADGVVVGFAGVQPWQHHWGPTGEPELGWRLGRAHWGKGLATRAGIKALGLAAHAGIDRVVCLIHAENQRSLATAKRLGLRHERAWTSPAGQRMLQYGRPTRAAVAAR
jgi:RimJ/RimL family protein N-acetyltransferase